MRLHHWFLPIFSAFIWWAMLALLFAFWAVEGFPNYSSSTKPNQYIMYISDISVGRYQAIFISGSAAQGILYVTSLASEIYLRCTGRLHRHIHWWSMYCLWLSLLFAVIGQFGILFVAIFDTQSYHDAHVSMLVVYIVFVGVSALFNVASAAALGRTYLNHKHVRTALYFKIVWFVTEFLLAVAFVGSQSFYINVPAVLEWIISFLYPFNQLILAWDLWPAMGKVRNYYPKYNEKYPTELDVDEVREQLGEMRCTDTGTNGTK